MDDTTDTAQVIVRPPLAWGLAAMVGLALNWLVPLDFLPADLPAGWLMGRPALRLFPGMGWGDEQSRAITSISRAP